MVKVLRLLLLSAFLLQSSLLFSQERHRFNIPQRAADNHSSREQVFDKNSPRNFDQFFEVYANGFQNCDTLLRALRQWVFIFSETAERAVTGNYQAQQLIEKYALPDSPFHYFLVREIDKHTGACSDKLKPFFEHYGFEIRQNYNLLNGRFGYKIP